MTNKTSQMIASAIKEKMRKELFREHHDKSRWYDKNESNIFFMDLLIKDHGIKEVASVGIELLKEYAYLLDSKIHGTPKNALEVLFKAASCEKEVAEALIEMYKKGNEGSDIVFGVLKNITTQNSEAYLLKLLKEMEKETRFSNKGDAKRKFIENYKTEIQNLINKFKPQELPLFSN